MIRVKLMVAGSHVVRDADTNTVSVFNILEGLAVFAFPAVVQFVAILVMLERDQSTDPAVVDASFSAHLGDLTLVPESPVRIDFEGKIRSRQILRINGLAIPAPGLLRLTFKLSGAPDATVYSFDVARMSPEQQIEITNAQQSAQEVPLV